MSTQLNLDTISNQLCRLAQTNDIQELYTCELEKDHYITYFKMTPASPAHSVAVKLRMHKLCQHLRKNYKPFVTKCTVTPIIDPSHSYSCEIFTTTPMPNIPLMTVNELMNRLTYT